MAAAEGNLRYEGWRVAGASAAGVFVSFASLLVYTFGIFLKPWAEEFSWSRESISAAFGIAAMTVAVCSPPLGYLLDRVSPARVIVSSISATGCTNVRNEFRAIRRCPFSMPMAPRMYHTSRGYESARHRSACATAASSNRMQDG